MIFHCTFEELAALTANARRVLADAAGSGGVAAPPEIAAELEALLPRLEGDLLVETLAEQMRLIRILDFMVEDLRDRMDALVLEQYVGAEDAVAAYFDYAHVLTMRWRLDEMGREMASLIELMTGEPPTVETARSIRFDD